MGGDHGPAVVVPGIARVAELIDLVGVRYLLHGDRAQIAPVLERCPAISGMVEVRHTEATVAPDAKPAHAMRRGAGTSMWNAVESVRSGEARAAVSAGNTGALMAIGRLLLRMIGELERPALVANWPTARGVCAVLDVGANIVCDAERLVEFALLGAIYHRAVHRRGAPTIGLLNVGAETQKGHEDVRGADRMLRELGFGLDYRGFIEGDDIAKGVVDVVVTDGFTGNISLKSVEGFARFFRSELRAVLENGLLPKIGAFIARGALVRMAARLDPSLVNGGPFLGLNGIVVKSHGGADARGYAAAVRLAIELARSDFAAEIEAELSRFATLSRGAQSQDRRSIA